MDQQIRAMCGDELEVRVHTRRKPRLIIINVPEDITTNKIEDTIIRQNPELNLQKRSIVSKFIYVTKKTYPGCSDRIAGGHKKKSTAKENQIKMVNMQD